MLSTLRVQRRPSKKQMKNILVILILVIASSVAVAVIFLNLPMFGASPSGRRLDQISLSPHYDQLAGQFRNLEETPVLVNEKGFWADLREDLFNSKEGLTPDSPIPSVKTDLKGLDRNRNLVVWMGHSSYFIQLDGRVILVDPIFSAYASPVFFANKAFPGSNPFTARDLPEIDFLLITHDHWDHLDYPTAMALRPKIKNIVTGLGAGVHFSGWGFPDSMIHEADWNTTLPFDGLKIHILPARHFSGRSWWNNKTLWVAFALEGKDHRIFLSGDSGYGSHFANIGEALGGFDLVSLDTGQYDADWPYVHMTPEEAAQAADDLKARILVPGHVGKFAMANHRWDEPLDRILSSAQGKNFQLLTPRIGEPVYLDGENPACTTWWRPQE
ncbi:MBL fold metallo-hydrolase [Desulfocurvus vexinensis]|uniref:MBL fold metallo-hydrolase n=1 Tax=Desulfocurvus vexinensis TaxID=399548 RepID=UPI0004B640DE|nr:MBL fold metallo-hydrolase [Desulfocurvus vexinensis]